MPVIYFVRHGQTDWNAEHRIQGHIDIPINATGREQAARNGTVLKDLLPDPDRFDFVSSPLVRAAETMRIVRREMGLDPSDYRTDLRLREIHFGDWQGRISEEIIEAFPEDQKRREEDRWNFLYPGEGAESFAIFSRRVGEWLDGVTTDTIATAHGGVMRCLYHLVAKMDGREAATLHVVQDKIYRIADGAIELV